MDMDADTPVFAIAAAAELAGMHRRRCGSTTGSGS